MEGFSYIKWCGLFHLLKNYSQSEDLENSKKDWLVYLCKILEDGNLDSFIIHLLFIVKSAITELIKTFVALE